MIELKHKLDSFVIGSKHKDKLIYTHAGHHALNSRVVNSNKFLESTLYKEVVDATSFLDVLNPSPNQRIVCAYQGISEIGKCAICNGHSRFKGRVDIHSYPFSSCCSKTFCKMSFMSRSRDKMSDYTRRLHSESMKKTRENFRQVLASDFFC